MDEQRIASYLELIQALLECHSGTVNDILNANRDLVDVNFVQVMAAEAANMAEKGNSKRSLVAKSSGTFGKLCHQYSNF